MARKSRRQMVTDGNHMEVPNDAAPLEQGAPSRRAFIAGLGGVTVAGLAAVSVACKKPAVTPADDTCPVTGTCGNPYSGPTVPIDVLTNHFVQYHLQSVTIENGRLVVAMSDCYHDAVTPTPCQYGGIAIIKHCPRPPCP